jgi:cytochrome c556
MRLGRVLGLTGAAALAGLVAAGTLAWANDDPIKMRRGLMKGNGEAGKLIGGIMEGSTPFDAAKVKDTVGNITKAGHEFGNNFDQYFPDSTMSGDTKASPDIWKNKDDFKKIALSLESDANAASSAADQGVDAFKAAAGKMFGNCKDCHEKYKLK